MAVCQTGASLAAGTLGDELRACLGAGRRQTASAHQRSTDASGESALTGSNCSPQFLNGRWRFPAARRHRIPT